MRREPTTERKALIVGGGIAGPVLAMFLQRAGITPTVYEGQPAPDDEAGYFLNLPPNGAAVLDTLGIGDEVLGWGAPTTSIVFHNHRGKRLGENPETTVLLKRGSFNKALREQATRRGVAIEFGKRLRDIAITPRRTVIARFEDGAEAHGDFLVGCDGIHSRTRRVILPDAPPPAYTGLIGAGGYARLPAIPPSNGVFRMTFGLRGFFGYQVAPSGEISWFSNVSQPTAPDRATLDAIPDDAWRRELLDLHRDDHPPIGDIIRATAGRIGRMPVYDLPSLPTWRRGPVCLIGDAAHATSPSAGQGAALALEDAIVLAQCLRDIPDAEAAFAACERRRKERVKALVAEARRLGNRKAAPNAVARGFRDLALPVFLKLGVKNARRAYAYRVDWDERAA